MAMVAWPAVQDVPWVTKRGTSKLRQQHQGPTAAVLLMSRETGESGP